MTSDTKAIIGTIVGTGLAVVAVVVTLVGGVRADLRDMRGIMERFDRRLDAVEVTLGRVVERFSTLEERVSTLGERFSMLEGRVLTLGERFSALEERFSTVERRLSTLERLILPPPAR